MAESRNSKIIFDNDLSILTTTKWCCLSLQKFDYDHDNDIYFDVVIDDRYDIVSQSWIKSSKPFASINYKSPGYYGDVDNEYLPINYCPFCGSKIHIKEKQNGK